MSRSLIGRLIRSQPSLLVSRNAPLTEDEIASYTTAHHQPAQLVQSRALHGEPDFLHDMSDGGLLKRPRHLPLDPLVLLHLAFSWAGSLFCFAETDDQALGGREQAGEGECEVPRLTARGERYR